MDLRDYLRVLRLRWRLITAATLAVLGVSTAVTLTTTPVYRSSAQLFVAATGDTSIAGALTSNQYIQQRLASYVEFINSPRVTQAAMAQLRAQGVDTTKTGTISAAVREQTVLLSISATAQQAELARLYADAVSQEFIAAIDELEPSGGATPPVKVTIIRPAGRPGAPIQPRPDVNALAGLAVGLFLGAALALVRETLDTRIASPDALANLFNVPTLATVGFDPDARDQPLVSGTNQASKRAEAYRRLRTNLQFVDVDDRPRSIVMTSAVPGEGKTTTACNLAILLAEAGVPVVLVEGDLRRPRVADYMGLEGAVGLTDVLIGQVALADALQPWGSTGQLEVLASGPLPPNPSEVLGSRHMRELLEELEERALVIIDAPPLLPVTDAAVLAAESSGAILVVRAKSTRREQVATSVQALHDVSARLLGAVFNMAPTKGPDAYAYRYGYYYYADKHKRGSRTAQSRLEMPVDVVPTRLGPRPASLLPSESTPQPRDDLRGAAADMSDLRPQA